MMEKPAKACCLEGFERRQEVFVGGEALPLSTCRSWLKKWPHVRLVVNYATTETVLSLFKRPQRGCCRGRGHGISPDDGADRLHLGLREAVGGVYRGMEMPFAPLSTEIVCWNNEMRIENEDSKGPLGARGHLP